MFNPPNTGKLNILFISPDFNYSCGVSKHIFLVLSELRKQNDLNICFITNSGDSLNRLENIGIKPFIMKFSRGWKNLFYILPNYFILKNYCKENKINIIHSHHRYPEFLAFLIQKVLPLKTVTTVHSLINGLRLLSLKSDRIIAVSNAVIRNLIQNFRINPEYLVLMQNFVEFKQINRIITPPVLMHKKPDDKVLLFLGRINKSKGIDVLIKTFTSLLRTKANLFLLLVGNFELDHRYFKIIQKNPQIFLINSGNDISQFYYLADIVLLPSRIDSFPYVMLESGINKKPFIGGKTGGIAEFIEHMKNGYLVEPGNVQSLTEAIVWMLDHPDEAKEMGEKLYSKVMTLNSKEKYIAKLIALYNELISSE
ncbi:MAG TPA: glycosyltransferase family 4 protein [Ignavibacteriaceae bacterium]|jgi:glycosyltransferase involved in cell wall biosynthesis|nr:glycosyltransferase family 4 protein [Ignavibacteriaceae bacterium]HPO56602.1 glycosyltransferase family 4 protein [Ignavibacteriaceae bacterium]